MNSDVINAIDKCRKENKGEAFLSLKPRIDDLTITVAHLYAAGGEMCHFNMPDGKKFKRDFCVYITTEMLVLCKNEVA